MHFRPVLAATLLAALTLAGCSGDGQSGQEATPADSVSAGASPGETGDVGPASTGDELADRLNQALAREGSYRAIGANPQPGAAVEAQATLDGDDLSIHISFDEQTQITRIDGEGAWFTDETGTWTDGSSSADLNDAVFLYDQRSQIAGLAAIPTMNNLGTEQVDGVTTTHYQGGTNAENYGEALNPPSDILQTTGGDVAVDIWVDDEDRIVRFEYLLIPGEDFSDAISPQTHRTDYSDFGAEVTITRPDLG